MVNFGFIFDILENCVIKIDISIGKVPSLLELEKNISFRIINTHQSMQFARPKMRGLTYFAGINIEPAKALPSDVQVSNLFESSKTNLHQAKSIKFIL